MFEIYVLTNRQTDRQTLYTSVQLRMGVTAVPANIATGYGTDYISILDVHNLGYQLHLTATNTKQQLQTTLIVSSLHTPFIRLNTPMHNTTMSQLKQRAHKLHVKVERAPSKTLLSRTIHSPKHHEDQKTRCKTSDKFKRATMVSGMQTEATVMTSENRQTDRQTDKDIHTYIHTYRQTYIHTDRQQTPFSNQFFSH